MKYYLIAGEASGDLHGSKLILALREQDPTAEFRAWGGDLMQQAGAPLVKHYRDLAFMGFVEVLMNIRTIFTNITFCKKDVSAYQPDVLILIDYPGFNLRIAKWAREQGIKVYYYISPQIWAWRSGRAHKIKRWVDRMFVILPFEKTFYQQYDYQVDFVGHPLLDVVTNYRPHPEFQKDFPLDKPVIALLPGSRRQEINKMLPLMLELMASFPDHRFFIAGAPAQSSDFYEDFIRNSKEAFPGQVQLVRNQTYDLLHFATAALVTSGTATLETALFGVPQIVCYKGSSLSYLIAKQLIKVNYISLVNIIAEEPLVRELIQADFNAASLHEELEKLLEEPQREAMRLSYEKLRKKLGAPGAARRTAKLMVAYLKS